MNLVYPKKKSEIFFLFSAMILFFFFEKQTPAQTIEGISFPETLSFNNKSLKLNGLGVRIKKILFIRAHVYAAGLYLEKTAHDFHSVLNSEENKVLELTFLRHVTPEQITTAWQEGFQNNCGTQCESLRPWIHELCKNTLPVESGEKMVFRFSQKGLEFERPHQGTQKIADLAFSKVVLASFIGEHPADLTLREGLMNTVDAPQEKP